MLPSRIGHVFHEAAEVARREYTAPIVGLVECSVQGFGSRTYVLTFADQSKVILQLRDKDRPLPLANMEGARRILGDLIPRWRSLGAFGTPKGAQGLAYEMSLLPGIGLDKVLGWPVVDVPLTVAAGLGTLFGKCSTGVLPETRGANILLFDDEVKRIRAAMDDPKFARYKADITALLARLDALDRLPVAISNDDISFTNVIISPDGHGVSGLVDWEWFKEVPLGYDLGFLHRLRGNWHTDTGRWVPLVNSGEIESSFFTAFFAEVRCPVTEQFLVDLETCMKLAAVVPYTLPGNEDLYSLGQLRMELDFSIPRTFIK